MESKALNSTESRTQFYQAEEQKRPCRPAQATLTAMLNQTVEIVRARVRRLGVSETLIQAQPPDRIICSCPVFATPNAPFAPSATHGTDANFCFGAGFGACARSERLKQTLYPRPSGRGNIVSGSRTSCERSEIMCAARVKRTQQQASRRRRAGVFFELQGAGSQRFADVTRQVAGKGRYIPIFLDQRCISARL
jgi:preprotein translocase subunit SecD